MEKRVRQVGYHHSVVPGFFLNVCPYRSAPPPHTRGGAELVDWVSCFFADLDWHGDGHHAARLPSLSERRALVALLPAAPSWTVLTGNGAHAYHALDRPYPAFTARRLMGAWRAVMSVTAAELGQSFDEGVTTDMARIMRVPGSWNTKTDRAKLVVLRSALSCRRYHPAELIGQDAYEAALRPASQRGRGRRPRADGQRLTAGWSDWLMNDPSTGSITAIDMIEALESEGWHLERTYDRDGDPCWALARPGKPRGTSATVRQYDDHAVFYCFSEAAEAAPFEPRVGYGGRSFMEALYGSQWASCVRHIAACGGSAR
jgi:hypothetical protein